MTTSPLYKDSLLPHMNEKAIHNSRSGDKLLGFYRQDRTLHPLYGIVTEYYDKGINTRCQVVIAPLGILRFSDDSGKWVFSEDINYIPPEIQNILRENKVLITQEEAETPYSMLMYPMRERIDMSRGGILLHREDGMYSPVIATIQGYEYLIELKGCGSPVGGFPNAHLRHQSGSVCGGHVRITGGLTLQGAKAEFDNLEYCRKARKKRHEEQFVRGLGYCRFSLDDCPEPYGMVIRLIPSSIRMGFQDNEAFQRIQTFQHHIYALNAGREVATLLEADPPLIHKNISFSNMLYVENDLYTLTDFEEADPAYCGHCNMEFPNHVFPFFFLIPYFQQQFLTHFIEGLCQKEGRAQQIIQQHQPKSLVALNELLIKECISYSVFSARLLQPLDYTYLTENIDSVLHYSPSGYYQQDIRQWFRTAGLAGLKHKLLICECYMECIDKYGIDQLRDSLNSAGTVNESILQRLNAVDSSFSQYMNEFKTSENYSFSAAGLYVSGSKHSIRYIEPPTTMEKLEKTISYLKNCIERIDHFLHNGIDQIPDIFVNYTLVDWMDPKFYLLEIFPFLTFVCNHFENERLILEGVNQCHREKLTKEQETILDLSLKSLAEKRHTLTYHPQKYHESLREGRASFLALIKLPYML